MSHYVLLGLQMLAYCIVSVPVVLALLWVADWLLARLP